MKVFIKSNKGNKSLAVFKIKTLKNVPSWPTQNTCFSDLYTAMKWIMNMLLHLASPFDWISYAIETNNPNLCKVSRASLLLS